MTDGAYEMNNDLLPSDMQATVDCPAFSRISEIHTSASTCSSRMWPHMGLGLCSIMSNLLGELVSNVYYHTELGSLSCMQKAF